MIRRLGTAGIRLQLNGSLLHTCRWRDLQTDDPSKSRYLCPDCPARRDIRDLFQTELDICK